MREYVEKRNGGYYLLGSRASLEPIVEEFLEGASPESIVAKFPALSLEQVCGAITFYLANRPEIDDYLAEREALWQEARRTKPPFPAHLRERLERAGAELISEHP